MPWPYGATTGATTMIAAAAAQAAWGTDRGQPIAATVVAALRSAGVILPSAAVIERAALVGRARARRRAIHSPARRPSQ